MSDTKVRNRGELVHPEHFILATRDTGYRSTSYALAELVDNAIQAGASRISTEITSTQDDRWPIEIVVTDDGSGMDASELRQALAFGGTTRFDDRSSLGRYGMGLPNGSLSRARRVTVHSWKQGAAYSASLDIDEIVQRKRRSVPAPEVDRRARSMRPSRSGTSVHLSACDRLEYRRVGTLASRLQEDFGRIYRRFLIAGLHLTVNSEEVSPIDPLFLDAGATNARARPFGDVLEYRLAGQHGESGLITVRFSELPVELWSGLPSKEKRALGVTNAPSCSIVRGGREIDRGWFFMGTKRRENYDDWWRCEIAFSPELDEAFGITHAKQQISPSPELDGVLAPDLEAIARALNARVRKRFDNARHTFALSEAERKAARADRSLPPLPQQKGGRRSKAIASAADLAGVVDGGGPYRIVVGTTDTTAAYEVLVRKGQLTMVLNDRHPFFRDLYEPLSAGAAADDQRQKVTFLALTVLAAARAEAAMSTPQTRAQLDEFRRCWSDVLATFFNA